MGKKIKKEQISEERLDFICSIERQIEFGTKMLLNEKKCTVDESVAIISQVVVESAKDIALQTEVTLRQVLDTFYNCMDILMTGHEEREGKKSSD